MARSFVRTNPDRITYPHLSALDGATTVAVSLWFYYTSYGNYDVLVAQHSDTGAHNGFALFLNTSVTNLGVSFKNGVNQWHAYNAAFPTSNAWYHVFVQYDGSETGQNRIRTWVNGILKTRNSGNDAPASLPTTTALLSLGTLSDGTLPLTGRLADVAIWTGVVLTAEERLQLTSGLQSKNVRPSAQVFRDRLAEGRTPVNEIVSAAGTLTGTTSIADPYALHVTADLVASNVWTNSTRTLSATSARDFDAASLQYLAATSPSGLPTSTPLTIATWFKVDDVSTAYELVSITNPSSSQDYFGLESRGTEAGDPLGAVARSAVSGRYQATSGTIVAGQWHHGAAVFASSTSRIAYLDGVAGTASTAGVTPASLTTLGVGYLARSVPDSYINGALYGTAIYTAALTASEIALLANGAHPTSVRPESLWEYWDLNATGNLNGINGRVLTASGGGSVVSGPSLSVVNPTRHFASSLSQYYEGDISSFGLGVNDPFFLAVIGRCASSGINTFVSVGRSAADRRDSRALRWVAGATISTLAIDDAFNEYSAASSASSQYAGKWMSMIAAFRSASLRELYVHGALVGQSVTSVTFSQAPSKLRIGRVADGAYALTGDVAVVGLFSGHPSSAIALQLANDVPLTSIDATLLDAWTLDGLGNITGVNGTVLTAFNGGSLVEGPVTAYHAKPRGIATDVWTASLRQLTGMTGLNLQRMSQMNFALPFLRTGLVPGA